MAGYSEKFFEEMVDTNRISAELIVPMVLSYVPARSLVDVGCGEGLWAGVFYKNGISDVLGIDGDWVNTNRLTIPKDSFVVKDLEKPFSLDRTFDLAVSLEVGEHLSDNASDSFIKSLTELAPVVLFSAAIPFQGGSCHINEQWPEYWEQKFAEHGYVPVDCIRRKVWNDNRVSFFYAQNIFFFVKKSELSRYPKLKQEIENGNDRALGFAHPQKYIYYAERWNSIVPFLSILPPGVLHIGKRLLKPLSGMPIGQMVRYLISGITAVGTNLVILYSLVEFGGLHYLLASAFAFSIGILVSFSLHKFFTFRENSLSRTHVQIALYLSVIGFGFLTNLAFMWFWVELGHIPYLFAAIITNALIAVANFFAYRLLVFRRH